jgi:outer membrane translocation and assembly module TamA
MIGPTRPAVAPMARTACASLLAGALAAIAPPTLAGQEPERGPEVEDVDFPGARALDEDFLEEAVATKESHCRSTLYFLLCLIGDWSWAEQKAYLDTAQLPQDEERLEALYRAWGYPDAQATARVVPQDDGDVIVEFHITEGSPILVQSLEIRGLDTLSPPLRLPDPLPLTPGHPYALPRLEATQREILQALAERGRPFAQIEVSGDVDEQARTASVVLTVDPGPVGTFGPVTVQAEPPIDEDVVLERLAYRPGDRFRLSRLRETERLLETLPIVENATVEPITGEIRDTTIPTRVTVATFDQVRGLAFEGTVSSTSCLEFAGYWRDRYFLGGPRVLSLGIGTSNLFAGLFDGEFPCTEVGEGEFEDIDYFVRAELVQPWPGHPRTSILTGGFYRRESSPQAYIWKGYGAELAILRDIGRGRGVASIGYAPERSELDAADFYFCANFGACSPEAIEEFTESNWRSPVELLLIYGTFPEVRRPQEPWPDHLGPAIRRWTGWVRGGTAGAAGITGSDWRYGRLSLEGAVTRIRGTRFEIAARARLGLLGGEDVLPPQVRFYSGGAYTVRGVPQNRLGPKLLVISGDALLGLPCEIRELGCPSGLVVDPDLVDARPTGGDALIEANLEGRLWVSDVVQLAAFLDFGSLWRDAFSDADDLIDPPHNESLLTPGVGIRLVTPVGAFRLDVGYDPSGARTYPLLTQGPDGGVIFLGDVVYDPFGFDDPGPLKEFLRRLQLHVAVGQPF